MEKCKYADQCMGLYPPRCGCRTCQNEWEQEEAKRLKKKEEQLESVFGDFVTMAAITSVFD